MSMTGEDFDLEAELNAALDGEQKPPAEEVNEQAPIEETPEQEQARYVREGRRFVKEQAKEEQKPVEAKEAKEPPVEAPKPVTIKPPLWYKNEYGEWDKYPEAFRKAIEQREREAAQGIEKHSTAAKAWEPINEALKPFEQQIRASGMTPQQYVGGLVEADKYLRASPVEAIEWLIQQYLPGYNVRALADWMDQSRYETKKVDPVQQELAALKQQVQQLREIPQQQQRETINRTISEWSKDKPDYPVLERTIMGFIQADPSVRERYQANPTATLDALYEQAQYAHPDIRQRILEERERAKEDQRLQELKRARTAGAQSPRGGQPNGATRNQRPTMSLEDEIAMHLDGGV